MPRPPPAPRLRCARSPLWRSPPPHLEAPAHQHRHPVGDSGSQVTERAGHDPGDEAFHEMPDAIVAPPMAQTTGVSTTVTELPESRVRVQAEVAPEEIERRLAGAAKQL